MKPSIALLALFAFTTPAAHAEPASTPATHCHAAPYHQLDFWLGDWDTFDVGTHEPSQARNRVTSILGGCVVREHYESKDGMVGESFSIYDASRKVWRQTWVTNRGHLLVLEGGLRSGRMMLEGKDHDAAGKPILVHVAWWPVVGGVREQSVTSSDGGKTWKPQFDIVFRPHRA